MNEYGSYWIVEWRYPKNGDSPASEWKSVERPPYETLESARHYRCRPYYEYRISEYWRITTEQVKP